MKNVATSGAFPVGLTQPERSYRFGQDALLLGSWAAAILNGWLDGKKTRPARVPVAELGSGCGAALFALAALAPEVDGLGLEREEVLTVAARENAEKLNLAERAKFEVFEIGADRAEPDSRRLIMANPPWRRPGSGRKTPHILRRGAMVIENNAAFYACASRMLVHRGFFCLILPVADFCEFCAAARVFGLGARRALPVVAVAGARPSRLLVCCRKNAASDLALDLPLVLYSREGEKLVPTREGVAFCPWL